MKADPDRLIALGELIRDRREAIPLTIEEATARAGFGSENTWLNLEHGRSVRSLTYAAAERRVLGWEKGACKAYLQAGAPPRLDAGADVGSAQQMADAMAHAISQASDEALYAAGIERHEIAVVRAVAEKIARNGIPGESHAVGT